MIPSRSRLQSWSTDASLEAAPRIDTAGQNIEAEASNISQRCRELPAMQAWEGIAQDAAEDAFERARGRAGKVHDLAESLAAAISQGAQEISATRNRALGLAADLESGDFLVADLWVVTLKPVPMSQERADELFKERDSQQLFLNAKVLAVDAADQRLSDAIIAAAASHGYEDSWAKDPNRWDFLGRPTSDIELFSATSLRGYQRAAQLLDAATTLASMEAGVNAAGEPTQKFRMQDGRFNVLTMSKTAMNVPMQVIEDFDPYGKLQSTTTKFAHNGSQRSEVKYQDGTRVVLSHNDSGDLESATVYPSGKDAIPIPQDSDLFANWKSTLTAGSLDLASDYFGDAAKATTFPQVRTELEAVKGGTKYLGAGVTVGVAVYDVINADSPQGKCQAALSSAFSAGGAWTGGAAGSAVLGPVGTFFLAAGASQLFGYVGSEIGAKVCYP